MSAPFTVLMPVLNAMPYLEECLISLERQSVKSFNVYVWDNGSVDGSRECLERWIPTRLPGKVFSGQSLPLGLSRAALIEQSPTELCALFDADDRCIYNRFEKQLDFCTAHPDIALFGTNISLIDKSGIAIKRTHREPIQGLDIRCTLMRSTAFAQSSIMLKKSAILSAGNFRHRKSEDLDLQLRVSARFQVANMPDTTVDYRVHTNSTSASFGSDPGNQDFAIRIFAENALATYGIEEDTAYQLRYQKLKYAFPVLRKIAEKIAENSNCSVPTVFRNQHFRNAVSWMISPRDKMTNVRLLTYESKNLNWLRRLKQCLLL